MQEFTGRLSQRAGAAVLVGDLLGQTSADYLRRSLVTHTRPSEQRSYKPNQTRGQGVKSLTTDMG